MELQNVLGLLLIAFVASGYAALMCIECDSRREPGCGETFTLSEEKYLKTCFNNQTHCSKTISTMFQGKPLVKRGCVTSRSNVNYTWNPDTSKCKEMNELTTCYCNVDRCNGSGSNYFSYVLGVTALLVTYLFKKSS